MSITRNKRRSLNFGNSRTISDLLDDPNQAAVHSAYLETAAIDVRKLETDTYRNRELDVEHVAELISNLKRGVRRIFKGARMRASMSRAEFDSLLRSYVTGDVTVSQARLQATNTGGEKLADFVYLETWPENLKLPSLIAGHHLRAALLSILEKQTKLVEEGGKTPEGQPIPAPSLEAYYWIVDIYETDRIQGDALTILQGNRDDPYKADSDGYNLLRILNEMNVKSRDEREKLLKVSNFGQWMQSSYGIKDSQSTRIRSIVGSKFWSDLWSDYVKTPYGQKYFNFTLAEEITNSKLESLWKPEITKVIDFHKLIFGNNTELSPDDWETVMEGMVKGARPEFFRRLFFPSKEDQNEETLIGVLQLDDKWFTQWSLPELTKPFIIGTNAVYTRRPGFLASLSDEQYQQIFMNLKANQGVLCPTCWNWVEQLDNYVFKKEHAQRPWRTHDENEEGAEFIVTSVADHIESFMNKLSQQISKEPLWKDQTVMKTQLPPPSGKKMVSVDYIPEELMFQYLTRFEQKSWASVVRLVIELAGPVLTGHFSKLNDMQYLNDHLLPFNSWGTLNVKAQSSENPKWQAVRVFSTSKIRHEYSQETETFSAMFAYRTLKRVMIKTLHNGYGGGAKKKTERSEFISNKNEWDTAMKELKEYAMHLNSHGFEVNIDRIDEPLTHLSLTKSMIESEDPAAAPIMGFMDTDPERFKNNYITIGERHKRLRRAMAADLERGLNDL